MAPAIADNTATSAATTRNQAALSLYIGHASFAVSMNDDDDDEEEEEAVVSFEPAASADCARAAKCFAS